MIRVRALERGFYDNAIREAGTEFDFDEKKNAIGSWMEPLDPLPKENARPKKSREDADDKGDVL